MAGQQHLIGPVVLAVILAGCGGGTTIDQSDAGDSFVVTDEEQAATRECLREAGLSSADLRIPGDAVGEDGRRRDEAMRCAVMNGTAEVDGDTPEERQATTDAAVTLVECMRAAGWTFPDPDPQPDGGLKMPAHIPMPESAEEVAAFREDFVMCHVEAFGIEPGG